MFNNTAAAVAAQHSRLTRNSAASAGSALARSSICNTTLSKRILARTNIEGTNATVCAGGRLHLIEHVEVALAVRMQRDA